MLIIFFPNSADQQAFCPPSEWQSSGFLRMTNAGQIMILQDRKMPK